MSRIVSAFGIGALVALAVAEPAWSVGLPTSGLQAKESEYVHFVCHPLVEFVKATQQPAWTIELKGACGANHPGQIAGLPPEEWIPVTVKGTYNAVSRVGSEDVVAQNGVFVKTQMQCTDNPWIYWPTSCQVTSQTTNSNLMLPKEYPLSAFRISAALRQSIKAWDSAAPQQQDPGFVTGAPTILSPAPKQNFLGDVTIQLAPKVNSASRQFELFFQRWRPDTNQWTTENVVATLDVNASPVGITVSRHTLLAYDGAEKWRLKARMLFGPGTPWTTYQEFSVASLTFKEYKPPSFAAADGQQGKPGTPGLAQPKTAGRAPAASAVPRPGALKLVSAQAKGPSAVEVVLSNPNKSGQALAAMVELRLGRTVVGQGKADLAPAQQRGIVVHATPPPGTARPVDVEVFVNDEKVGVAKLAASR